MNAMRYANKICSNAHSSNNVVNKCYECNTDPLSPILAQFLVMVREVCGLWAELHERWQYLLLLQAYHSVLTGTIFIALFIHLLLSLCISLPLE